MHLQKAESGAADDAVKANHQGITTHVYGKNTSNMQIRGYVECTHNNKFIGLDVKHEGNKTVTCDDILLIVGEI